jgi:DNA ligase-1
MRITQESPTAISRPRHPGRAERGLVLEVAFEGLQRSTRHKSGLAMRFPRINRLRWDKRPADADRLETLERMLETIERGRAAPAAANQPDRILS